MFPDLGRLVPAKPTIFDYVPMGILIELDEAQLDYLEDCLDREWEAFAPE